MREDLVQLQQRARRGLLAPVHPEHRVRNDDARVYRPAAVLALFAQRHGNGVLTRVDSLPADPSGLDIFLVQRSPDLHLKNPTTPWC